MTNTSAKLKKEKMLVQINIEGRRRRSRRSGEDEEYKREKDSLNDRCRLSKYKLAYKKTKKTNTNEDGWVNYKRGRKKTWR
jgi:hypothetical protein